jgi:hypothetical protein
LNNQELAIHLIQEQIRNQVLILALEKLGFDCTIYTLNISEKILTLIGFRNKSDELYQRYFELIEKAAGETDYGNMDEKLREWSVKIYSEMNSSFLNIH